MRHPASTRFVLVGTSHPGNLGATARAMKTMALTALDLVALECAPDEQAQAMAANADDVLNQARHFSDLSSAVAESQLVLGLTARARRDGVPALTPREAATMIAAEGGTVSVLFGRERTGLTNEELAHCHRLVHIPANPDYPALNLAAAVQIMAYEIFLACPSAGALKPAEAETPAPATGARLEGLHQALEALVQQSGYAERAPREVMLRRLRNLFNRARPSEEEVDLLRGILKRILN